MANLDIAKEILNQLKTLGMVKMMSWGTHNIQGGRDFLIFNVQGHHLKGKVKIILDPMDVYNIEFYKLRTTEPFKRINGIYFDNLVDTIDKVVEYIPAYKEN